MLCQTTSLSPSTSSAPYRVFNIGHGKPVKLMAFIQSLENALGISAMKNFMPMQDGDVYQTFADVDDLFSAINYQPKTSVVEGVSNFVTWYRQFYQK